MLDFTSAPKGFTQLTIHTYIYVGVRVCWCRRRRRHCRHRRRRHRRRREMGRKINKNKKTRGIIYALQLYYMLLLLCTYTTPGQAPGPEGGKGSIAAAAHNVCTAEG